jgi:hypothetical protein
LGVVEDRQIKELPNAIHATITIHPELRRPQERIRGVPVVAPHHDTVALAGSVGAGVGPGRCRAGCPAGLIDLQNSPVEVDHPVARDGEVGPVGPKDRIVRSVGHDREGVRPRDRADRLAVLKIPDQDPVQVAVDPNDHFWPFEAVRERDGRKGE